MNNQGGTLNITDFTEIITFLFSLLVVVWKIAEIKAKLEASIATLDQKSYKNLDNQKDFLQDQIDSIDKTLSMHIQSCIADRDKLQVKIQGLDESTHRINKRISGAIVFERLEQRIITLSDAIKNQG